MSCETWPRSGSPAARRAVTPCATSWVATSLAPARKSSSTSDGSTEAGFRVFVAGGLGANPFPAMALEDFTSREDLLATIESVVRVFNATGERDNKLRARMKWVVQKLGWEETQRRILKERRFLLASSSWPGGIPAEVLEAGDEPAGADDQIEITAIGQGTPVSIRSADPYTRWDEGNVVRGRAKGTVSAIAYAKLGDITSANFRALASIQRELNATVRITNRQNLAFRDLTEEQLNEPETFFPLKVYTCHNCFLVQVDEYTRLDEEGLSEVGGIRFNISGCTNSCGQHHIADIGFSGAERRAHGQSAPGYTMLLGGYVGEAQIHFGERALRLPAKNAPEAAARVVRRFNDERQAGESFRGWIDRSGGVSTLAAELKELDEFPLPDESPDFYVDLAETGESECAT